MSNNYIAVGEPATITKKLDTEQLVVSGETVQRERIQVTGDSASAIAKVANSPASASDYGLVTRAAPPYSPHVSLATSASIAAGGQITLSASQVSVNKTAHLTGLVMASSVPFKAELRTIQDNIASTNLAVFFAGLDRTISFNTPGKGYISVAYSATAGLDAFQVIFTNLDTAHAADVYCTFFYDEE